jgi:hypothetical protein
VSATSEFAPLLWEGRTAGRLVQCFFFALAFCIGPLHRSEGAEQPHQPSLEDYLKRLRYEPVAFEYHRNQPLIDGQLAGKKCVFLVDTGCTITKLDQAAGAGLKTLEQLGVVLDDPWLGSLTNASIVLMEKLTLGRAQFMNQPAERKNLDMDFVALPYEGILGFDFLLRNFCLIDCANHRLYVRGDKPSEETSKALAETLHRSGFTDVNLRGESYFKVEALINNQPAELLVDTGAFVSTVDQSEVKRLASKR